MKHLSSLTIAALVSLPITDAFTQASLTALGTPLSIDLTNTVTGVNNGLFDAQATMGSTTPDPGQLDLNAWDYLVDGNPADVPQAVSVFPGTLPAGNGVNVGGSLSTGLNATDINGVRALAIQPTGGHWTSGHLTLRIRNNTGQSMGQLVLSYNAWYFNDAVRSNALKLFYSTTNTAGSYVPVSNATVISPTDADAFPQWVGVAVGATIQGFNLPDGGEVYLRWVGEDVSGSGTRDEFAVNALTLTGNAAAGTSIATNVTGLPAFTQQVGTPSASQTFTISGIGLFDDVNLTTLPPFEISLNAGSGYGTSIDLTPTAGTLASTTIHVRLNAASAGPYTGSVACVSPGTNGLEVLLSGTTSDPSLPVLFFNELLSSNTSGIQDENGEYDDWFEIHNPNGFDVDLAGWFVSDNANDRLKYRFHPDSSNAVVPAGGWLLVWADNQSAQGNLHTNFALSSGGEDLVLTAPDSASVVHQISFGAIPVDESYGMENDGALPYVLFTVPTPGASNNPQSVVEWSPAAALRCWPNPTEGGVLYFDRMVTGSLLDVTGRVVLDVVRGTRLSVDALPSGPYLFREAGGYTLRIVKP